MTKTRKRRVQKTRTHQSMKSGDGKSIDWMRILLIVIGIVIVLSMMLSLMNFQ
jgi:hypothetical protein